MREGTLLVVDDFGGPKEGPDDRVRIGGTKDVEQRGIDALLRLKFCSFDDPGAMPCRASILILDPTDKDNTIIF
jgi:hypothetical protein